MKNSILNEFFDKKNDVLKFLSKIIIVNQLVTRCVLKYIAKKLTFRNI